MAAQKVALDDYILGSYLAAGGAAARLRSMYQQGLITLIPGHSAGAAEWLAGRDPGTLPRAAKDDPRVGFLQAVSLNPTQTTIDTNVNRVYGTPGYPVRPPPKAPAAPGSSAPGTTPTTPATVKKETAADWIARMPWLEQAATRAELETFLRQGLTGDAFVNAVRSTATYARNYAGNRRPDGSLRATEAQFTSINAERREILRANQVSAAVYDDPLELAKWWEAGIDVEEMKFRFDTWRTVQDLGPDIQDAMYVYAGLNVSNEDLYRAITDPGGAGAALSNTYNQKVATQNLDYKTFITRATTAGLNRVVKRLGEMQKLGIKTNEAIGGIREVDPNFARTMMELLYTGGGLDANDFLELPALERAFEFAMIGSAATQQGFTLPDADRVAQIRQAGIGRAQALQAYGEFAARRGQVQGTMERLNRGVSFDERDWEEAVFLASGEQTELLRAAEAREQSYGQGGGTVSFRQDPLGRLRQTGLRVA